MTDEELMRIKDRHEGQDRWLKNLIGGVPDRVLYQHEDCGNLIAEVERLRAYDDELRITQHLITNIGWWAANGKSETVSREIEAYWVGWRERYGKS